MTPVEAQAILADNFASWVQALGLQVIGCDEGVATLIMPFDQGLVRVGGTICGQALMSAADTAMVLAISSTFGSFRPMATVSQNISFMRPIADAAVQITARVMKPGKTIVFGEIELRALGDERLAAHATTTYAVMG